MDQELLRTYQNGWEKDGYFVIRQFASASEVTEIFDQINSVFNEVLRAKGHSEKTALSADEKYEFLESSYPQLKSHAYDVLGKLDSVLGLISKKSIREVAQSIYQTPLLLDRHHVRINDPKNDRLLPLHQERGQISHACLTMWIPLHTINRDSGGLWVVPGSHRRGRVKHQFFPEHLNYHGIQPSEYRESELELIEVGPGDAVCFHPWLFHGSRETHGQKTRWTVICRYSDLAQTDYLHSEDAPLHTPMAFPEDEA